MLSLQESFQNIRIVCDDAVMNKRQRTAIDESLGVIATTLNEYKDLKDAAVVTVKEKK